MGAISDCGAESLKLGLQVSVSRRWRQTEREREMFVSGPWRALASVAQTHHILQSCRQSSGEKYEWIWDEIKW